MTPQILRKLRLDRDLTREGLAQELGCSAGAIVQWETEQGKTGHRSIPAWVEEKMLRTLKVTLPLDDLHWLLSEAMASGQSAESILADALRLWLNQMQPFSHGQTRQNPLEFPACTPPSFATPAPSTGIFPTKKPPPETASIAMLPPPPVLSSLNETATAEPAPTSRSEASYSKPKPKRKAR